MPNGILQLKQLEAISSSIESMDMFIYFSFLSVHLSSFKDQIEGARLLSLLAQINSWPAAIFTELKYEN
jgi:hypothetical protein